MNHLKLNYNSFLTLLKGESITIERIKFNVEWKTLNVNLINTSFIIQGLKGKVKTIFNTPDINYKFISFPIKYNLILHPLIFFKFQV